MSTTSSPGGPAVTADPSHDLIARRRRGERRRDRIVLAALVLATLAIGLLALYLGSSSVIFSDTPHGTLGGLLEALRGDGPRAMIVREWRLPRVVAGLAFGAALGASGAIFQTLTRNALGSPDVLGFSTGSYTGVLVATVLLGAGGLASSDSALAQAAASLGETGGALLGGIGAAILVYVLAYRDGIQGFRLIIVGIAVAATLSSVNTFLLLRAKEEVAMAASIWGAGSFDLMSWPALLPALAVLVLLTPAVIASVPVIHQLELGDDTAAMHGVRVERARRIVLLIAVALVAVCTAVAGPIAFIALSAPQVGRLLVRRPGIPILPAALVGALLLTSADVASQQLLPQTVPVGMVTVVLGGVYLVALLIAQSARSLRRRV
ncbi:iron chelate uptake ABC transporter family permease subunit [Brachybacterium sp. ACRRE]|uniref:FecCD family ABC transporter permease n=1 Tax=Brachybacterium sp. ACRRE TaxID=2918184 RepID=UPI001EF38719|nr:iron chelate uptake ABC transporter family permease subunit [Brachybacterium sp. ACRRE]